MTSMYKISCTVYGHNSDVRSVTPSPLTPLGLISGSRDLTARIWVPDSDGKGYHQSQCFDGHTNFVSCVAAVAPSDENPDGLVFTGCSDKLIRVFSTKSDKPLLEMRGHTDTVCALVAGKFNMLVSGSWDKTARVWVLSRNDASGTLEGNNVMNLTGHTASVWAVLIMQQGIMATGSADKTIRLWKAGKCLKTLTGHDDCVRDLAIISACQFLSCANDATVRKWTTTGQCLQVFYGHTSFVYSIYVMPGGTEFVTSGEDRSLRVWSLEQKEPVQNIALPAQSAWDVAVLDNGDLVTGLSDGTIRIFSRSAERIASDQVIAGYERELSSTKISKAGNELGDIDVNNTPGLEILQTPGQKDGQVQMARNGDRVEAHQWDAGQQKWLKIGDVVGGKKEKKKYNGKEYDFVFDVDIQQGAPTLKLPYNMSEDPWFAAQRFIDDNDLSQDFLDQICTFILDNTKEERKNAPQAPTATYADPFTGGGRYVPNQSASSHISGHDPFTGSGRYMPGNPQSVSTNGMDPFTGGGRYMPGSEGDEMKLGGGAAADPMINPDRYIPSGVEEGMDASPAKPNVSISNKYFPKQGIITFENANLDAILGKLKTFSASCDPLSDAELQNLRLLVARDEKTDKNHLDTLWKVLSWPSDYVFPALDILRLACLGQPDFGRILCSGTTPDDGRPTKLLDMLCNYIAAAGNGKQEINNKLLSIRTLCNLFWTPDGTAFLAAGHKDIFKAVSAGFSQGLTSSTTTGVSAPFYGNKNIQIAAATLFLNYAVMTSSALESSEKFSPDVKRLSRSICSVCLEATIVHLVGGDENSEPEALFRYLVCLGTLLSGNDADTLQKEAKELGATRVVETTERMCSSLPKISGCAQELLILLDY